VIQRWRYTFHPGQNSEHRRFPFLRFILTLFCVERGTVVNIPRQIPIPLLIEMMDESDRIASFLPDLDGTMFFLQTLLILLMENFQPAAYPDAGCNQSG
jgi:hypothetical protein